MSLPLDDLRVISIEQYGAGPFATLQLADLGADVIRIEDPTTGGDSARYVPPYAQDASSLFFETFNRNKRSVCLDLHHPLGRQALEDLVRDANALTYNLRGDQPEKLRLRYDDLRSINPELVCVSISAFGLTGPRAAQGGYDFTIQGITGWMALTGGPDQPPTKSGLSLVDYSSGYLAALAVVVGVHQAQRSGKGCDFDLSLFDTALAELTYVATWVLTRGYDPPRMANSAHLSMVPFQTFDTADDQIVVACPKQSLWLRLCRVLHRPDLASDPRFATFEARQDNRWELCAALEQEFQRRTSAEWLAALERGGVPCGAVNDVASALVDPQAQARGSVLSYPHPVFGTVETVAGALRSSEHEAPARRAPFLGEHTDEVLRQVCGYSDEYLVDLRAERVTAQPEPWREP
jgi:crotonobetainyl-CoA:carnitine CoA-transferase CaiB-like acyl-CoA transferase